MLPGGKGFVGGPQLARPLDYEMAHMHLASTYAALCLLLSCGDLTFERVDKQFIL